MKNQSTARPPKTPKRRISYAAQWDRDAQAQRHDTERYAAQWDAQAKAAGNPQA